MSRPSSTLAVLLLACGALAASAADPAPSAEELARRQRAAKQHLKKVDGNATSAPPLFRWDIPEVVHAVDVPETTWAMGVPVRMRAFRSRLSLPEVMKHVARSFVLQKLYVAPDKDLTKLSSNPQLTGFDPFRNIGYTAIFQANADGSTTVIMGEAHLDERREEASTYFVPLYPGAQGAMQSLSESGATLAYTTTAPRPEIDKFYAEQLPKLGWRGLGGGKFVRGADQVVVTYRKNLNAPSGVVISKSPYAPDAP